jgi:hypothetical protein
MPRTSTLTKEEAKERQRLASKRAHRAKNGLPTDDESLKEDLRHFNRGRIKLTEEEKAEQKRLYNLNAKNKSRSEQGLPPLTLDDISRYKVKPKKVVEERIYPLKSPERVEMNMAIKKTIRRPRRNSAIQFIIIDEPLQAEAEQTAEATSAKPKARKETIDDGLGVSTDLPTLRRKRGRVEEQDNGAKPKQGKTTKEHK